ncbi:MAG: deoxyribodipyrimidine photo-lyase [Deltaproteobacteria bacterium]|nr:deoxyribodipyrimidine photo-lyase [Deltaproteobacteria bacterium]
MGITAVVNPGRVRLLKDGARTDGPVLYWMSRDQRTHDNWALLYAQELAIERGKPLAVLFCLVPSFLDATARQYIFMLKGLEDVERSLLSKNIPLFCAVGMPEETIPHFIMEHNISILVTDFDPLKIKREWKNAVAKRIGVPFQEVDAHNIVPCWVASERQDFAARTFRPKINRRLTEFLTEFPKLKKHPHQWKKKRKQTAWGHLAKTLAVDRAVSEIDWIKPGEGDARRVLRTFLTKKLEDYDTARNDPTVDGQSHLSPYLHFGHMSAQRVVLEVIKSTINQEQKTSFLEELIIRRELSDNFCFYNDAYDTPEGFPTWARTTLFEHARDEREYIYSLEQFESAATHDPLWNAAQTEMVTKGKMHGYMRMYWAKKILEWSKTPGEAFYTAVYLNDRYELDGRDPNGYVGCAWSIGGVHDRAWFQRPVFGKIRYMSYSGCKSKFDVAAYIHQVNSLQRR